MRRGTRSGTRTIMVVAVLAATMALVGGADSAQAAPTGDPGPVRSNVWQPPPGAVPATGNVFYVQSDRGDSVGAGRTWSYPAAVAQIDVLNYQDSYVGADVVGDERANVAFVPPNHQAQLVRGYYGNVSRRGADAAAGGLDVIIDGRGCSALSGWFQVDDVAYSGSDITRLTVRFEQSCDGESGGLRGLLRWDRNAPPARPWNPSAPPSSQWRPSAGSTPAGPNWVRLESRTGDFIGQGQAYTYTANSSLIVVATTAAGFTISVAGHQGWSGDFAKPKNAARIERGWYGDLRSAPGNPLKGGLDWGGQSRGCSRIRGWFAIDDIAYRGNVIVRLAMRFGQSCEETNPYLYGAVRFDLDARTATGPLDTPSKKYIDAVYRDLLDRAPDPTGMTHWINRLHAGASRAELGAQLVRTTEYRRRLIRQSYDFALGRTPNAAELDNSLRELASGRTVRQLVAQLLASDEFFTKCVDINGSAPVPAGSIDCFMTDLYRRLMFSDPDAGELHAARVARASDAFRSALTTKLMRRTIALAPVVVYMYTDFLRRVPDLAGTTYWVTRLRSGVREETIAAQIIGSSEYYRRAQRRPAPV